MDGKGRALDNVFDERLWRTVKYEEVYMHDYASPHEARQRGQRWRANLYFFRSKLAKRWPI